MVDVTSVDVHSESETECWHLSFSDSVKVFLHTSQKSPLVKAINPINNMHLMLCGSP